MRRINCFAMPDDASVTFPDAPRGQRRLIPQPSQRRYRVVHNPAGASTNTYQSLPMTLLRSHMPSKMGRISRTDSMQRRRTMTSPQQRSGSLQNQCPANHYPGLSRRRGNDMRQMDRPLSLRTEDGNQGEQTWSPSTCSPSHLRDRHVPPSINRSLITTSI
jgi:hypothetical protein